MVFAWGGRGSNPPRELSKLGGDNSIALGQRVCRDENALLEPNGLPESRVAREFADFLIFLATNMHLYTLTSKCSDPQGARWNGFTKYPPSTSRLEITVQLTNYI